MSEERTSKTMNDLSDFDLRDRTAVLELRNPLTGETIWHDDGRPFAITLRSRDHLQVEKASDGIISETLRGMNVIKGAARVRDDIIKILTAATVSWDIIVGGECPECTPLNVTHLYRTQSWIREQVDTFVSDRTNFLSRSKYDA